MDDFLAKRCKKSHYRQSMADMSMIFATKGIWSSKKARDVCS